ncbi:hypothetical protein V6N13_098616 [Hibiscus sabdariffa]|uniref:Uncharacterized protein n=1 Tax=Hibiscus sabdariffa TaxID=183260 RepID=A0ABR2EET7_9ROSI
MSTGREVMDFLSRKFSLKFSSCHGIVLVIFYSDEGLSGVQTGFARHHDSPLGAPISPKHVASAVRP